MPSKKYALPEFLIGRCDPAGYVDWLSKKAKAHVKRDRHRGHTAATRERYMMAIHQAVVDSKGRDYYTGEPLAWELISTYNNEKSQEGKRIYKKSFWLLPTVDHFGEDLTANAFKICGWRTNDCKNDLTQEELIEFCELVLSYYRQSQAGNE